MAPPGRSEEFLRVSDAAASAAASIAELSNSVARASYVEIPVTRPRTPGLTSTPIQLLALRVLVHEPSIALAGLLALASTIVALMIVNTVVSKLTIHGFQTYVFAT
jgi:hypothetical protein